MTTNASLDVALAAHLERPLGVTTYARQDLGITLFPRQAEFLEACFPKPATSTDPIFEPDVREAVALWGKGSGKDTCAAVAQVYTAYRLCLLEDPQDHFDLSPTAPNIDLINVAQNAKQARDVFFAYVKATLRGSHFFSKLLPRLTDAWDPDTCILANTIRFPNNVYAHSLHSHASAAEGYNTFLGVMDEADAFRESSDEGAAENADEIHETLLSTMASRFPRHHLLMVLSWPRHLESFTMQRYDAAMKGAQRVHGSRGATWDIREDRDRSDFDADYEKNPEQAAARYETNPPATVNAFFTMPEKLDARFTGDSVVEWEPTTIRVADQVYTAVNVIRVQDPPQDASWWIHGDAGLTGDSYGLALVRADDSGHKNVDAVIQWKPRRGTPVYFPDVERVILELLAAGYRILGVSFDRWNSAESIQRLQSTGVHAEAMTFTQPQQLEIYEHLKTLVYNERITMPAKGPAIATLNRELRRLQLLRGSKIDHPQGDSKDLADAVAAAAFNVYHQDDVEIDEKDVVHRATPPRTLQALGTGGFNDDLLDVGW